MNNKKRKISIVLILVLTTICLSQNMVVFAGSLRENIEAEVREKYENDPMFILETQEKGSAWTEAYLNRIIDRKVERAKKVSPYSDPDAIQQVSMTAIEQTEEYNCGPTNALMVLYTAGRASRVSGSNDAEKIETLSASNYCDCDENSGGSMVYKVKNTINAFMPSNQQNYSYEEPSSKTDFIDEIYHSLQEGYAAIMHSDNSELPYWDGYGSGHYVSVYYINTNTTNNTVKVADSYNGYYCENSPYLDTFGKHTISINDAYYALKDYVIYYE